MQLKIGTETKNNKVQLVYKSSPTTPKNAPKYWIDKTVADEFVKKYNIQNEHLKTNAYLYPSIGGIGAFGLGIYNNGIKNLKKLTLFTIIGAGAGALISTISAYKRKNNLMDKYDVKLS